MAVSQADFRAAQGYFFDLDTVQRSADDEITAIGVTIQGINGSRRAGRRNRLVNYRLLADVDDLPSGLPEGWVAAPEASEIEHLNIWPASMTCPLTNSRLPRICWGTAPASWLAMPASDRTLGNFLELARQVLNDVNLLSPAR